MRQLFRIFLFFIFYVLIYQICFIFNVNSNLTLYIFQYNKKQGIQIS